MEPIPLERYPDKIRVELIGENCQLHGREWVRKHPDDLNWLRSQGVSIDEAIAKHRDHLERIAAIDFFEPAALKCPKCHYGGREKGKGEKRRWVPAFDAALDQPVCRKCGFVWTHERVKFNGG